MPINWTLYEQEVMRLYVDGNATVAATLKCLKETYGVRVTPKQFKTRFGGLKNLRADEWKVIFREIQRRRAEGKSSEVYLYGRKVDPGRLEREFRRHYKDYKEVSMENNHKIDLGIGTCLQHRIEIRSPDTSSIPSAVQNNPTPASNEVGTTQIQDSTEELMVTTLNGEPIVLDELSSIDLIDYNLNAACPDVQEFSWGLAERPNTDTTCQISIECQHSLISKEKTTISPETSNSLALACLEALPFGNYGLVHYAGPIITSPMQIQCSIPEISGTFVSSLWDFPEIGSFILNITASTTRDLDRHVSNLPWAIQGHVALQLLNTDARFHVLKPIADLVEYIVGAPHGLHPRMSYLTSGEITQRGFQATLAVVAYLSTNNFLSTYQMRNLLNLLLHSEPNFLPQLLEFMRARPANAHALTVATIRHTYSSINEEVYNSKNGLLDQLFSTNKRAISSCVGGELLHESITIGDHTTVRLLVGHGVDVNFIHRDIQLEGGAMVSPVFLAISRGLKRIASILIKAGADVNKRVSSTIRQGQESPLSLAVRTQSISTVKMLLDFGAKADPTLDIDITGHSILKQGIQRSAEMYELLRKRLPADKGTDALMLVDAAEKGNKTLSKTLFENNIVQKEVLERALYQAVKLGKVGAVRTLLRRGVNPNANGHRLTNSITGVTNSESLVLTAVNEHADDGDLGMDLVYLLIKSGAKMDAGIMTQMCHSTADKDSVRALYPLLDLGLDTNLVMSTIMIYNAAWGIIYNCGDLIDKGAQIDGYGVQGRSALQVAAGYGHFSLVQFLIDEGANINLAAAEDRGRTALQAAAEAGHLDMVDYLVDVGADVTLAPAKDSGITVLEAIAGDPSDPDFYDDDEKSDDDDETSDAQEREIRRDRKTAFKKLLALGSPINRDNGADGTVLHRLIHRADLECFRLALQAGARTEDRDSSDRGFTPLQTAIDWSNTEAIHLLLEHGADLNAPAGDMFGRTALQAAISIEYRDPDIIELLLLRGADVNAAPAGRGGITALQAAAISGDIGLAKVLLMHGADVNAAASPEEGRTALEGAAEHGRLEMVRLLLSISAKIDPLRGLSREIQLADENGHLHVGDFLREQWILYIQHLGNPVRVYDRQPQPLEDVLTYPAV